MITEAELERVRLLLAQVDSLDQANKDYFVVRLKNRFKKPCSMATAMRCIVS